MSSATGSPPFDAPAWADVARGACLLGSGGGGPLHSALALVERLEAKEGVEVISVERLLGESDPVVACVAWAGLPSAASPERTFGLDRALRRLENRLGRTTEALMPVEVGALNCVAPAILAAERRRLGSPARVVDADWAGRSVPSFEMLTLSHPQRAGSAESDTGEDAGEDGGDGTPSHGAKAYQGFRHRPVSLASAGGETVLLELDDIASLEELLAATVSRPCFGGLAGIAWPITHADLEHARPVCSSLDLCRRVGRVLATAADPLPAVLELTELRQRGARELFRGHLDHAESEIHGDRLDAGVLGFVDGDGRRWRLVFHNETLLAAAERPGGDFEVRARAPESIGCYAHGRGPFSNAVPAGLLAAWREERRPISVVALGAPPPMARTNDAPHRAFRRYLEGLRGREGAPRYLR
ncbi:MAG: DUF917 domain-containing protein [Holophagales bacterium]|nr:DUF917 domain-containing protein [Holophagales bacterium]